MKNDRKERSDEEPKKQKFKVVDRRRINADDIEASDAPEETAPPQPVPPAPAQPATDGGEVPTPFKEKPSDGKPATDEPGSSAQETAAPDGEAQKPDEDPLSHRNIVMSFMQTLATIALVDLGLVPHPQTGLVAKRMEEARKAIDLFEILLRRSGPELPQQIQVEFERALQDLKASYVAQL